MTERRLGYPIDLRPEAMRRARERSHLGDIESRAARIVARLTGEDVYLQDDNTMPGMPDLRIDYRDRPPAYVEVVTDIDKKYGALVSAVRGQQQIDAASLERVWYVTLDARAHLAKLGPQLPARLAALQRAGTLFDPVAMPDLVNHPVAAVRELEKLGVVELASVPAIQGDGKILLYCQGASGPTTIEWAQFNDWLDRFLASDRLADVRRKLKATGADERHVFAALSFTTPWVAFHASSAEGPDLLAAAPHLPEEITHVWLWAQPVWGCLVWFPDRGWFDPKHHWATD